MDVVKQHETGQEQVFYSKWVLGLLAWIRAPPCFDTLHGRGNLILLSCIWVTSGPVPCSHVTVALRDGRVDGQVPVLAVHVVCSRTRVIPQPNTEVLDLEGLLLPDLFNRDNLSGGLLELPQLSQEVPKPGFCHNLVSGKDPHPV